MSRGCGDPCHPPEDAAGPDRIDLPRGGDFCASCGRMSLYLDADGTWTCPGCRGLPDRIPRRWRLTAPLRDR